MRSQKSHIYRNLKRIGIIFVLFLVALVVFHKSLVVSTSQWMLNRLAQQQGGRTLSYEALKWEEGNLVLSGLVVKDPSLELTCDKVEVAFSFQWFKLCLHPKITVIHPEISLHATTPAAPLPLLYSSKWVEPEWEIQHGVLQCATSRFYFSLFSGAFTLAHEPHGSPLLSAEMEKDLSGLHIQFQLQERALHRLLPLIALTPFQLPEGWNEVAGEIDLKGNFSLPLQEIHLQGSGADIVCLGATEGKEIRCKAFEGSLDYVDQGGAFWEELSASLSLKEGRGLIHSGLEIADVNASLLFVPQEIPFLSLQGTVFSEGIPFNCRVEGRGGKAELVPFFAELTAEIVSPAADVMQVTMHAQATEESSLSCEVCIEEAHQEHIELCRALTGLQGECVGGQASLKATLLYNEGKWEQAVVEHLEGREIRWYFPEESLALFAKNLQGSLTLHFLQKNPLEELKLLIEEGQYVNSQCALHSISTDLLIQEGLLHPSQVAARWEELHFQGTLVDAPLCLEGDLQGEALGIPLDLHIACTRQRDSLGADVEGKVAQDLVFSTATFSSSLWEWPELFWGHMPSINFKEAIVKAPQLQLEHYKTLLAPVLRGIDLSGTASCEALVSQEKVIAQVQTEDLILKHPLAQCTLGRSPTIATLSYEYATEQFFCEIHVKQATLTHPPSGIVLEKIDTLLHITKELIEAAELTFTSDGIAVKGTLKADPTHIAFETSHISGTLPHLFSLLRKCSLLEKIPSLEGGFSSKEKGFVLHLPLDKKEKCQWQCKGEFSGVAFPINEETSLRQGKGEISIDSKTGVASLGKAEAIWTLREGREVVIQAKQATFNLLNKQAQFLIKVVEGKKEFALVQGSLTQLPTLEWEMTLDPRATHIAGIDLQFEHLTLNSGFSPLRFEMRPRLTGQQLPGLISFLRDAGFVRLNPNHFSNLQGTIEARLTSQRLADGFSVYAKSQEFNIRNKTYSPAECIAHKKGNHWRLEKLTLGSLALKATFTEAATGFTCPQFEGNFKGIALKGGGYFNTESKEFSCQVESCKADIATLFNSSRGTLLASFSVQGDFSEEGAPLALSGEGTVFLDMLDPVPLSASSKKTLRYTYQEKQGLTVEGCDFQVKPKQGGVPLAQLKAQTLTFSLEDVLALKALQFSMTPAAIELLTTKQFLPAFFQEIQIEGSLQGRGELQFDKTGLSFQGNVEQGRYGMKGISLPVEQLQVIYEKKALSLRAKTQIENNPLWGSLQLNLSKEPYGVFKLFDHPKAEGLKVAFHSDANGLILDSAQGSCYGLTSQLTKSIKRKLPLASVLTGDLKFDFSRLITLFPEKTRANLGFLKLGSGYAWQGDLVLWQEKNKGFLFSGALVGNECELLGYRFQKIETALEATNHKFLLSNLKIDDEAGALGIKKIECHREGSTWDLYIPQLLVQKLQPSMLRKIDAPQTTLKPFRIEQFTLSDIRAHLNDLSTLEGTGRLLFVNQFKKETSLFDLPLEMIKKLGLDLSVLTPVQGEFHMELRGDKFYLLSLDHAFSEAERSTFYLAPSKQLSYIDLKGEVHIDLKMQQDVVFKILEPFTLTIRGTLDKPRYGLQF